MVDTVAQQLIIPALRSQMGDWSYYSTSLKMRDVAQRVTIAQNFHKSKSLNELIQRQLEESHANKIKTYLLTQPQRFFNSIVVGIYGGAPQWAELDIKDNQFFDADDLPEHVQGAFGLLLLDGTETIFAIDGQHRVIGIKKAVESNLELGTDQVSVIFVGHKNDPAGLERTRRLFTSLNRYAKPINLLGKIALDEDDIVAIVTRRLIDNHPLFTDKVALVGGTSISSNDRQNLTTLAALYKSLDTYLQEGKWAAFKRTRPDDVTVLNYYEKAFHLCDILIKHLTALSEFAKAKDVERVVAKHRNMDGGNLIFRPIGFMMMITAIRALIDQGVSVEEAVQRIAKLPLILNKVPWADLLWNTRKSSMLYYKENKTTATQLLIYMAGGNLSLLKPRSDFEKLRTDLASILKISVDQVQIEKHF